MVNLTATDRCSATGRMDLGMASHKQHLGIKVLWGQPEAYIIGETTFKKKKNKQNYDTKLLGPS